jgi:hypothetical protein
VENAAKGLSHLWSLQVYLAVLGGLSLIWLAVRFVFRSHGRAQLLLSPRIPLEAGEVMQLAVDRELFLGVTAGQFLLAGFAILPNVVHELTPVGAPIFESVPLDLGLAWMLIGMLALGWAWALWGWRGREAVVSMLVLALTGSALTADWFREELATASALRWGLSLCWLACSALIWQRGRLRALSQKLGIRWPAETDLAPLCRILLLAGAVVPVLLMTGVVANLGFVGQEPSGPLVGSIFERLGWITSMVVPLGLIGVGLFGHGVRENSPGYVFSAGLVLLGSVTGGYALGIVVAGGAIDETVGVYILQLGALAAGGWAFAWLLSGPWWHARLIGVQVGLAVVPTLALLVAAMCFFIVAPAGPMPPFVLQAGQAIGWVALAVLFVVAFWFVHRLQHVAEVAGPQDPLQNSGEIRYVSPWSVDVIAGGGALLGILTACSLAGFDQKNWLCYHVLIVAGTLLDLLLLIGSWIGSSATHLGPMFWPEQRRARLAGLLKQLLPTKTTQVWVDVLSALVALLALRGAWEDPGRPYWSCLATLAMAVLIGAQAVWVGRPAFVYVSGLLLNLAGYLAWQAWLIDEFGIQVWFALGAGVADTFLFVQILCLAAGSLCWSVIDWRLRLRTPPGDVRGTMMPYPHAAVLLALHLLVMLVLIGVGSSIFDMGVHLEGALAWSAMIATFLALMMCWWDAEASLWGLSAGPMYLLGLTALGLALQQTVTPTARAVAWTSAVWLAAYLFLTNGFIRLVPRLSELWRRLRLPPRSQDLLAGWYWPMQGGLAGLVLGLSVWICLDFEPVLDRLAGPLSVGLGGLAALLAIALCPDLGQPLLARRANLRLVVLGLAIVFFIELSWALLDQELPLQWLHRHVLVLAVLTWSAGLLLSGKMPWGEDWAVCAKRMGLPLAMMAGFMLVFVLFQEFFQYDRAIRRTPLALPAFLLILLLLVGLLGSCLWIAVWVRNPLGLSDRGRVRCVWSAEFLAAIVVVHLRLGLPDLFPGFLGRHWTFVVMVLAFIGVGLAELFRRRGLPMLFEPLQQTGIFLPLLPLFVILIGASLRQLEWIGERITGMTPFFRYLERLPQGPEHAALWFLLCLLYACVAVLRRSSGFALVAALAANFGLWVIYAHHEPLRFLLHPQLWLVPLGLIILAAEHVNRPHLTHTQSLAVRYVGLLLIYISSTADLFIAGLGSVEYAVALALFSVAGVLAGIMLRVRAYLFLGVTFLFLVVFSQIWHAAVNLEHTWVWWASGIVLGAAILILFALFEKRRNDLLRMIDDIRQWH